MLRKAAHMTEYAVLALLLFARSDRELPAFLLGVAYAVTDEIHQEFVRGRHASPLRRGDRRGRAAPLGLLLLHATRGFATTSAP